MGAVLIVLLVIKTTHKFSGKSFSNILIKIKSSEVHLKMFFFQAKLQKTSKL